MHWSELVFNIIFLISILVISRIMYVRRETKYGAIVEVFLNQNYQGLKEKTLKLWIEYDMCTLIPISEAAIEKYNSLCFILAILALSDKNDQEFLNKINAMKRDEKSEVKTFILAIYYYAKQDMDAAYKYYNKFLSFESQREERNIILGKLFSENMGAISKEAFEEALYNCKIPVITEMLKDVCC